ncbi:MFS transporter [Vigna unguiculata]|uniref:MFS transporter n=1 Tax=Vigna unguiculata TaxID=3917 RepID=A0A4D6KUB5_VIGUN|nr:MFS transporter [Vigna unguiculata]
MAGYVLGMAGGVTLMDSFLKEFYPEVYQNHNIINDQYCKFDSPILTWFISSLYLAAMIGSLLASTFTRLYGRLETRFFGNLFFHFGIMVWCFPQQQSSMLMVGCVLLGFGIGWTFQSVPIYISEFAPYKYRGSLNMLFQLTITIGIFVANVFNYIFSRMESGEEWFVNLLYYATFPAVMTTLSLMFPLIFRLDTPISLIVRGFNKRAKITLIRIRGTTDVKEEFEDLLVTSESSKVVKHPWVSLLKRQYRPQLTFAIVIPFFQQLTGMNVIVYNAPVLFKTIGFEANASLLFAMITGCCNVIATLVSIFTVDKFGRRSLFLKGVIQMFICQIVIAIAIACKFGFDGNPRMLPKWYVIVVVCGICVYVTGIAWSWGPLGCLVPSEIFPLEVRSSAQSITVSMNMIFTFVVIQNFTNIFCHMKFGLFIFFACFIIVMSTFIDSLLPETKEVPIEKMHVVWQSHPYWKKFDKQTDVTTIMNEY